MGKRTYNVYLRGNVDAELLMSALETEGITDVNFDLLPSGNCQSNYLVGQYKGKTAGVLLGRPVRTYELEARGLSKLSHKSIPQCYDFGELNIESNTFGYLSLQHFPGTNLKKNLDFSTKDGRGKIVRTLTGLVDILDYIHSAGVVHRDVVANHVIVNGEELALVDFHGWDDAERISPIVDFCGSTALPQTVLDHIYSSGRTIPIDEISDWNGSCYGILLEEAAENEVRDAFSDGMQELSSYLLKKSRRFIDNPRSCDIVTRHVRASLKKLADAV
ncbi:MAG: hypothetical protein ABIG30_01910 [Candidatus Aenigmatarchaeota archaeon]